MAGMCAHNNSVKAFGTVLRLQNGQLPSISLRAALSSACSATCLTPPAVPCAAPSSLPTGRLARAAERCHHPGPHGQLLQDGAHQLHGQRPAGGCVHRWMGRLRCPVVQACKQAAEPGNAVSCHLGVKCKEPLSVASAHYTVLLALHTTVPVWHSADQPSSSLLIAASLPAEQGPGSAPALRPGAQAAGRQRHHSAHVVRCESVLWYRLALPCAAVLPDPPAYHLGSHMAAVWGLSAISTAYCCPFPVESLPWPSSQTMQGSAQC